MLTPTVVERPAQPYVAIRAQVTMQTMDEILPPLHQQLRAWLRQRDITACGPPFWKYNVIDMDRFLEVEVGVPLTVPVPGADRVLAGVLPAGRYVTVRHTGHPDDLLDVIPALRAWGTHEGLTWDMTNSPEGEKWGSRLEIYETDPDNEPDMTKWTTRLAFRVTDEMSTREPRAEGLS